MFIEFSVLRAPANNEILSISDIFIICSTGANMSEKLALGRPYCFLRIVQYGSVSCRDTCKLILIFIRNDPI